VGAPPGTRARARTNSSAVAPAVVVVNGGGGGDAQQQQQETEVQNERALEVLNRVEQKLNGRDFKKDEELPVVEQVNKLIMEATKLENLCQHYIGWCSFW
jgi:FKBP12-rapamycin complex-associated protein